MAGISAVTSASQDARAPDGAADAAQALIDASQTGGVVNTRDLAADVADLIRRDPEAGAALQAAVEQRLSPVDARRFADDLQPGRRQVELEPGDKDKGWNKDLNVPLAPDTDYQVGRYTYATDDTGRVQEVTGRLELKTHDRNGYQQSKAGQEGGIKDGIAGDEGGHLIAAIFNGPGEQINYHAMDGTLNKSGWKKMENDWAEALEAGQTVDVEIKATFEGDSKRPDAFRVDYAIDGKSYTRTFFND